VLYWALAIASIYLAYRNWRADTAECIKKTAHAAEQEREDVAAARQSGGQSGLDPSRLIFIDETGASTKMARLRGRAVKGERCVSSVPFGHWKTTTFTAGFSNLDAAPVFALSGLAAAQKCDVKAVGVVLGGG